MAAKRRIIGDEMVKKILEYYDKGKSADNIGRIVGCSADSARRYIVKMRGSYTNPDTGKLSKRREETGMSQTEMREKAISLYNAKYPIDEIATYLNITPMLAKAYIASQDADFAFTDAVLDAPLNIIKLNKFKDNIMVGDELRVRKEILRPVAEGPRFRYCTAQVLSKYPFVVSTTEGDFSYVDLFLFSHKSE